MEATRIFNGDMFIVPSAPMMESELNFDGMTGRWESFREKMAKEWKYFGIDVTEEERFVRIWTCSPGCENWADHHISFRDMVGIEDKTCHRVLGVDFPSYFPASIIKDAKENGEPIILEREGLQFELTPKQSEYRYRDHGDFQTVMKQMLNYVTPKID